MSRVVYFFVVLSLVNLGRASEPPQRVPPPHWTQDVLDAFFEDAREQLVGSRPKPPASADAAEQVVQNLGDRGRTANKSLKWSELIDADTLTGEVRRLSNQLADTLKKPANFRGGGSSTCGRDFGMLAVLFGVIADYDQTGAGTLNRWQSSARLLQASCQLAHENCQAAAASSFAISQETHVLLETLIRGQLPQGKAADTTQRPIDRVPLMHCMQLVLQDRLAPTLTNQREFRRRSQLASEQAQLLAVLAQIIQQPNYEYTDDDAYQAEAQQLRRSAGALSEAATERNYEAARAAAGQLEQSCSNCHEGFRG